MRVLAFDTATAATTVALAGSGDGEPIEARDDPEQGARPRHTTRLMALIVEVLERAGCGWTEIDRIAVGVGPGTFTGLRIGIATGRALARARGIPLVGVSTLQSLALGGAQAARSAGGDAVLAVLDARRGEVFAAAWATPPSDTAIPRDRLLEPIAIAPDVLATRARALGATRLAIGDGSVAFRRVLEGSGTSIPDDHSRLHRVDATYHCRLASRLTPVDGDAIAPEYLRLPDAELARPVAGRR